MGLARSSRAVEVSMPSSCECPVSPRTSRESACWMRAAYIGSSLPVPVTSWSMSPTVLRPVRYLADTPRIMRGFESISRSCAFNCRASASALLRSLFKRTCGASLSKLSGEETTSDQNWDERREDPPRRADHEGTHSYSSSSSSISIAAAASRSHLSSCASFVALC